MSTNNLLPRKSIVILLILCNNLVIQLKTRYHEATFKFLLTYIKLSNYTFQNAQLHMSKCLITYITMPNYISIINKNVIL